MGMMGSLKMGLAFFACFQATFGVRMMRVFWI